MSDGIDQLSYTVGELAGQVKSLNTNMERFFSRFEDMEKKVNNLDNFKAKVCIVASLFSLCASAGFNYMFKRS